MEKAVDTTSSDSSSKKKTVNLPPITVSVNNPSSTNTTNPPDLLNVKITNPLVYIKYWWKRIMANEGIDLRLRAKPITVFGVAVIAFSLAFGLGGVVLPTFFPWIKINNGAVYGSPTPTPVPQILKDTALKGTLTKTNTEPTRFYLITTSTEAVTLIVPDGFNLTSLVGKRILVVGMYDLKNKKLEVKDIQDLEVLSTTPVAIPTTTPTPKSTETPVPTIEPTILPSESSIPVY